MLFCVARASGFILGISTQSVQRCRLRETESENVAPREVRKVSDVGQLSQLGSGKEQ